MNTSVSASASGSGANITNVSATVQGNQPNLVITPGTTSVSITGTLADPFSDFFTYVEQGKTNLNTSPVTVEGTENMPSDKVLYDLNQDGSNYVSEFFDITVEWESGTTAQTPATFTLELKIYNEWEGIRSFISNYY
jgi:hypothetical protein